VIELALSSCGEQDAFAEQVEFGAAVYLSFDHFDAVDGAFDGNLSCGRVLVRCGLRGSRA
jgi:hypothetical protein